MKNIYATVGLNIVRTDLTWPQVGELMLEWGCFSEAQEVVWIVTYDPMVQLRSVVEVARGNQFNVEVDIASVMQAVWATGTNRFQMIHNHPSGNVKPTAQDRALTEQVALAAGIGGLFLEDHVVIGPPKGWFSLKDHGLYEPSPRIVKLTAAQSHFVHTEER